MALIEVSVPDIGDFKDVAVIEILVKPGDTVAVEQSLVTVESDKASMEIPSSAAGVVKELKLALGDKINQGTLILLLESSPLPLAGGGLGRGSSEASPPASSVVQAAPPSQPSPGQGEGAGSAQQAAQDGVRS